METKFCKRCGEDKPIEEFSFLGRKEKYHTYCKVCVRAHKNEWEKGHKERRRIKNLKYKYDFTIEEYNQLFNQQGGRCAICGTHQKDLRYKLIIDHDHDTIKVRGLLCYKCNTGLGQFNDQSSLLMKAFNYLNSNI